MIDSGIQSKASRQISTGLKSTCSFCSAETAFSYAWNGFELYKCSGCGSESVDPIPTAEALAEFYREIFYKQNGRLKRGERWQTQLRLVERAFGSYLKMWTQATERSKPERFLDLGGGLGYYAKAAQNQGIESCLMDYSDDALEFGRNTLGISWAVQGDIQKCAQHLENESFDFVLARHIIEHMRDPHECVENLALIVRPGGLIQIETPNVVSNEQFSHPKMIALHFKMIRKSNPSMPASVALRHAITKSMSGVNPPKHLWGFTAEGLHNLLEEFGFEVLETNKAVCGHSVFDPLFYDLHRLSTRKNLGIPYYFFERITSLLFAGNGMNLTVLARKR